MIRFAFALIASLCLPIPAMALSCMPHNHLNAWHDAAASDASFVVVTGRLTFDEGSLPRVDWSKQMDVPPQTRIKARLRGTSLTLAGFSQPFDQPVTLLVECYGPWCASAQSGVQYLAFLERTDRGYVLSTNPCGGFAFGGPSRDVLRQIEGCMRGDACTPPKDR